MQTQHVITGLYPAQGGVPVTLPRHLAVLAFCCASALAACAPVPDARTDAIAEKCPRSSGGPLLVFELFLGRSMPSSGEVTDRDWDAFINKVVTQALPQGFTVYDAAGGWMSPVTHKTIHEPTKVLMAAMPDSPGSFVAIERVRNDYRIMFHQQAVGMTVTRACGAF